MSNLSMKMAASVAIVGGLAAAAVSASAALNLAPQSCAYSFATNMKAGSRGTDVMNLQKVLNMYPQTQVSASGAGSPGMESTYFGAATRAAVNKFQALHLVELGITAPTGNVFAGTRGLLNMVCNGSVSTNPGTPGTTQSGPVSVMVASSQPNSLVVSGQAAANLGNFVFSGTGVVKNVKLTRIGLSDDQTLTNVYLYDGMNRVAGPASVSRDGSVLFTSYSGLFSVTGSRAITVRGDVATNKNGQTIGFAVSGVDTGTGLMTLVNVNGPQLSIGSVTLASVNVSSNTTLPAAQTINAGSMSQNVWERSISVGTRDVKLARAMFKMIGSAPYTSVTNAQLNIDGANVSAGTADSNGYISFVLPSSYTLTTGTHIVKVFVDVVGGANRNFYVSLEQVSDFLAEDSQVMGAYVTLGGSAAANMVGGVVTINSGNFTITQDTAISNVTTLVGGATNQVLAKWKFSSYGEDVKVLSLGFTPTISGTGNTLTNVGLYINGGQVRSNQTATAATALNYTDLGTNVVVPAGQTVMVELRGDLVTSTGTAYTTGSAKFDIIANASGAQGMSSQNIAAVPAASGQTFTIGGSNVAFALAAGSAARTVAPNTANVKIGSFVLQTGSAEGVNVTQFVVGLAGTLLTNTKLSNLTVKDGATVIGNVLGGNLTASNTFSANVNVPVSTTKTFDVYADINSGAATYTVTPTVTASYTGLASRQSATSAATAGVVTTANVAVINTTDIAFVPGSSPVAQFVLGGTSNLSVATFNIKNTGGIAGAVIKDMVFTVPTNTVSSVVVNGKTATVVGTTATVYDAGITVPSDAAGINVPVTVALVCVNASAGCAGVSNSAVTLVLTSVTYNNGETVAGPVTSGSSTPSHVLVASKPTVTMTNSTTQGLSVGNQQIGTFTISADAAGDVKIQQIPVVTGVNGTITIPGSTVELRDASGNVLSSGPAAVAVGAQNLVFATPRTITKGTSETFTVYATTGGTTGSAGTSNVTFSLGAKASFLWTDVIGAVTGITGANLNTYPTTTQTKSN